MHDRSILLVEDNPDDEALTRRALAKNNIQNEILLARDGAEALDWLFSTGAHAGGAATPELVLLDLKLPKVDGLEVLRRIRANPRTRLLPVVILTSSREEKDVVTGYGLGANSYIRKPVDFGQFVEAVRQLGIYWLVLNAPPPKPAGPAGAHRAARPAQGRQLAAAPGGGREPAERARDPGDRRHVPGHHRAGAHRAGPAGDPVAVECHLRVHRRRDSRRGPRGSHRQLQPEVRRAVAHSRLDPRDHGRPPDDSVRTGVAGRSPARPGQGARPVCPPRRIELRRPDVQGRTH